MSEDGAIEVSDVTSIEYNRWLVEEGARSLAEERKLTHDEERKLRQALQEQYVQKGSTRAKELKVQMATAKAEVAAHNEDNLRRGAEVKDEVTRLTVQRKTQHEAWLEHGSALSTEYGSELRRKIVKEVQELTTRKLEASKALRTHNKEDEELLQERKARELEDAQKLREDVARATSMEVTRAAKDTFYKQRANVGDQTRDDMRNWKASIGEQRAEYGAKAAAVKAEATAIKRAAKEAQEAVKADRARQAAHMRTKRANIQTNHQKVKSDVKQTNKAVHDKMKTGKYVSPSVAEAMAARRTQRGASPTGRKASPK